MGRQIRLSVGRLTELLEDCCDRCFWITYYCRVPYQMGFPAVFTDIDRATKDAVRAHLDRHRTLPAWFPGIGRVVGYVAPHRLQWRVFWIEDARTGILLRGEPDDVFRMSDGSYHIVDYKTARVTEAGDPLLACYEIQLNAYAYIAERIGLRPVSGLSLVYLEPRRMLATRDGAGAALVFRAVRKPVRLDPDGAIPPLLRRAWEILRRPTPPPAHPLCEDCGALLTLLDHIR